MRDITRKKGKTHLLFVSLLAYQDAESFHWVFEQAPGDRGGGAWAWAGHFLGDATVVQTVSWSKLPPRPAAAAVKRWEWVGQRHTQRLGDGEGIPETPASNMASEASGVKIGKSVKAASGPVKRPESGAAPARGAAGQHFAGAAGTRRRVP